jgi:hypothetical protein
MGARMIVLAPVDGDPRIQEVLHIEKHEAICDLSWKHHSPDEEGA